MIGSQTWMQIRFIKLLLNSIYEFWPIQNFDSYLKLQTENILESSFLQMQKTPQGFPFYLQWGSSRYASNLAFIGLLHNHLFKNFGFQNDIEEQVFDTCGSQACIASAKFADVTYAAAGASNGNGSTTSRNTNGQSACNVCL